ncbi:MAG TPA: hypothetical protein VKO20_02670 [Desulfosalsimonadaceae bacterium]|nr:hypothetical protein [Desulfosalsimonadaceae bacterium]
MGPEATVATQPVFYLFIAFTILLVLGYCWGRRRNVRIYRQAFEELIAIFDPRDRQFTNIGGLTGYHAKLFPKGRGTITRVDATITLLPRQALLYYPVSRILRGFDRLFITLHLKEGLAAGMDEAHLIEKRYAGFKGPKITNQERLRCEEADWGGMEFFLYSGSGRAARQLRRLLSQSGLPGTIRHIALVPEQEKVFVFMIPRTASVSRTMPKLLSWVNEQLRSGAVGT